MDTQQFCQCPNCRKLEDPDAPYEARNSRLVYTFTNAVAAKVAQKHPGLLIKTIAYQTYLAPPPFKMRDNVVIEFCRFMCHNHFLGDPACLEDAYFNKQYLAWQQSTSRLMFYEYYYKASWDGLPWPIVHTLRRDLPYLHEHGTLGVASQWNNDVAGNGLDFYVATKLLWNLRIDVDALLSDFYEKAYGPAAAPMRRYHERLETAMEQSGLHIAKQRAYREMWQFFTPALLQELQGYIDQAKSLAKGPYAERVNIMTDGLQYARLVSQYLNPIAHVMEAGLPTHWYGEAPTALPADIAQQCQAQAEQIKAFIKSPAGRYSTAGFGSYEKLLLDPKDVISGWFSPSDRPTAVHFTKVDWLKEHPAEKPVPVPKTASLWIYGNDIDWAPDTGPEYEILALGRGGKDCSIGKIGHKGRDGNRVNMAFILPHLDLSTLSVSPLRVTVVNLPGGPYSSRIFSLYLMPDDAIMEDDATRLIRTDLDAVRRRAIAFVEFGFNGEYSNEGSPAVADVPLPAATDRADIPQHKSGGDH